MQRTQETGSIPGAGRSPGGENGNPLQYSCLENPMDREAWWATVYSLTGTEELNMHVGRWSVEVRLRLSEVTAANLYQLSHTHICPSNTNDTYKVIWERLTAFFCGNRLWTPEIVCCKCQVLSLQQLFFQWQIPLCRFHHSLQLQKKTINEWRTIPASGGFGVFIVILWGKEKQSKTKKKKKSLVYPLRAMLCVPNLNTKVRIKSIGIKIACSPCFEV